MKDRPSDHEMCHGHCGAATNESPQRNRRAMTFLATLRILLLAIAALGYFANGAQAHLKITKGETLSLMLCSIDSTRTVKLDLPNKPAQEEADNCCGDCAPPTAIAPPRTIQIVRAPTFAQPVPSDLPEAVSPRSPLWPGAPPHGPPAPHKHSA